ncbi:MAG: sigma-70 family RNA polymerase sigma factor, partial [Bacteroidaceae bacterium]|nr:sigma-70 family RNA polymerase sigma factor [Bacteroidaceae bacterium]
MDRQTAYTELLERYRLMVWRLCWVSANGNWSRCNDLVQEVSIALWLHFDTLRLDATPGEKRAWVYWQCRSTLDLQRRLQKPSMQSLTNLLEESVADEDTRRTQEEIEDLMAVLSPEEQRLVKLYLEGY